MILLTGGSGAVGRAITHQLISEAQKFVLITRSKHHINVIAEIVIVEEGDLLDPSFLHSLFNKYPFKTIIHCAWDGVTGNFRNHMDQIDNFIVTKNLLELAGKNDVKTFIGLGSQAEYGIYNKKIFEDFLPQPNTLYGVYKLSCGLLGKALAQQYGFRFAWLRLFAAYGPDDNRQFVIPYAIDCFLKDKSPDLSSGEQSWDYLFLPDVAMIINNIIWSTQKFNDIYNLSFGRAQQIKQIIMMIKDIVGSNVEPNFGAIASKNDLFFLEGANDKLKRSFKIEDLTDINKGLSLTIDWYKNHSIIH